MSLPAPVTVTLVPLVVELPPVAVPMSWLFQPPGVLLGVAVGVLVGVSIGTPVAVLVALDVGVDVLVAVGVSLGGGAPPVSIASKVAEASLVVSWAVIAKPYR